MIRPILRRLAAAAGYELRNPSAIRPESNYTPWTTDAAFQSAYRAIRGNTMVDEYRCFELWQLVGQVHYLPGALLEVGAWRGGTGALMAARAAGISAQPSAVYVCDTFRGMVKADPAVDPSYRGGELADTSRQEVLALCERLQLSNVHVLEGVFPEDTGHLVTGPIKLCHIDVDVYASARDVLAWAWPRVPVGGVVVYDDYGFTTCAGVTKHVDEQRQLRDRVVIHNLNGHAVVVKTEARA